MLLSGFDIVMVVIYAIIVLIVGMWPTRLNRAGSFLISDRQLGGATSGFTIAASKIGAGAIVTYAALIFTYGAQALWMYVGYILGYVVFYFFASRLHRESREAEYYTIADYFRVHSGNGAAIIVGLLTTVSLFGWVLTNFIAGGKLLALATGLPLAVTMCFMATVILAYLVVAGFNAVVRTDVIQYVSLIVVLLILACVATFTKGSEYNVKFEAMPVGQIVGLFVLGLFFPMGSAELWQRVYATRDPKSLRRAVVFASASFVILAGALSVIFLKLAQLGTPGQDVDKEIAVFRVVGDRLGSGLTGIWVIALLSAIASSADTFVFTTSASVVVDVAERFLGMMKDRRVYRIRVGLVITSVLGIALALVIGDVINVTFLFAGMTMGLGAIAMVAWLFPTLPSWVVISACTFGNVASLIHALLKGISVTTAVINLGSCFIITGVCAAFIAGAAKIRRV